MLVQIKAATLRDLFALCAPITHFPDVPKLNQQLRDLLDGRLVEFCGQERNTLLHEVNIPRPASWLTVPAYACIRHTSLSNLSSSSD